MDQQDKIIFLYWLINRLRYKHHYGASDPIIIELSGLLDSINSQNSIDIKDSDLDKIISRYFIDFLLDKTDDFKIGYSEHERSTLRNNIKSIIIDVMKKDIPTNYIS